MVRDRSRLYDDAVVELDAQLAVFVKYLGFADPNNSNTCNMVFV